MSKKSTYRDSVITMRLEGKSYKEIKSLLGCSFSTIHYITSETAGIRQKERKNILIEKGLQYADRRSVNKRNKKIVQDYLMKHPCVDCGISDTRVLEFDHVRGTKLGNISHGVRDAWKVEKLLKEIEKCEIRCANCHRIVTKERIKITKH